MMMMNKKAGGETTIASNKNDFSVLCVMGFMMANKLQWSKLRDRLQRFEYHAPTSTHDPAKRTKERAAATFQDSLIQKVSTSRKLLLRVGVHAWNSILALSKP
jgi:hypothetical protein